MQGQREALNKLRRDHWYSLVMKLENFLAEIHVPKFEALVLEEVL